MDKTTGKQAPIGVILAAGMAKRLRPLTDERPKCLLTVGQRTLLQRTIDGILDAGIKELVVVTGYRGQMICDFLTQHYPQLTIHFLDNVDYANNNNIFSSCCWTVTFCLTHRLFQKC